MCSVCTVFCVCVYMSVFERVCLCFIWLGSLFGDSVMCVFQGASIHVALCLGGFKIIGLHVLKEVCKCSRECQDLCLYLKSVSVCVYAHACVLREVSVYV